MGVGGAESVTGMEDEEIRQSSLSWFVFHSLPHLCFCSGQGGLRVCVECKRDGHNAGVSERLR